MIRLVVFDLERLHAAGTLPHATETSSPRMNHDHVRAHLRDLFPDAALRPLTDRQHRNDRTYADDDAEHRQKPSKLVVGKRLERNLYQIFIVHNLVLNYNPLSTGSVSSTSLADFTFVFGVSSVILPSRRTILRLLNCAISGLWVTNTDPYDLRYTTSETA